MEFYAKPKRLSLTPISVSIPNGMEFYFYASMNILLVWGVSIPNRMKFYPARNESRRLLFQVSIPNGMEFYAQIRRIDERKTEFQFPTGWNSTEKSWNEMSVSVFQFPTGWNSTFTEPLRFIIYGLF